MTNDSNDDDDDDDDDDVEDDAHSCLKVFCILNSLYFCLCEYGLF